MGKINVHVGIKLPIPGVDYSNIDLACDIEDDFEGDVDKAIVAIETKARHWVDSRAKAWQGEFTTLIEEQTAKLQKARETYLEQKKQIEELQNKLSIIENAKANIN